MALLFAIILMTSTLQVTAKDRGAEGPQSVSFISHQFHSKAQTDIHIKERGSIDQAKKAGEFLRCESPMQVLAQNVGEGPYSPAMAATQEGGNALIRARPKINEDALKSESCRQVYRPSPNKASCANRHNCSSYTDLIPQINPVKVKNRKARKLLLLITWELLKIATVYQATRSTDSEGNVSYHWYDHNGKLHSISSFEYTRRRSMYFDMMLERTHADFFEPIIPPKGGLHCWQYVERKQYKVLKGAGNRERAAWNVPQKPPLPFTTDNARGMDRALSNSQNPYKQPVIQLPPDLNREVNDKKGLRLLLAPQSLGHQPDSLFTQLPLGVNRNKNKNQKHVLAEAHKGFERSGDHAQDVGINLQHPNKSDDAGYDITFEEANQSNALTRSQRREGSENEEPFFERDMDNLRKELIDSTLVALATYNKEQGEEQQDRQGAVFGSVGIALKQGTVSDHSFNDVDILFDNKGSAHEFIKRLSAIFQLKAYYGIYKKYQISVGSPIDGQGKEDFDKQPEKACIPVFVNGKPWFWVEASVKPPWMNALDLSASQYTSAVALKNNEGSVMNVSVLSASGYMLMDSLSLEMDLNELRQQAKNQYTDSQASKLIKYSVKSLFKVDSHEPFYQQATGYEVSQYERVGRGRDALYKFLQKSRERLLHVLENQFFAPYYMPHSSDDDVERGCTVKELKQLIANDFIVGNEGSIHQAVADVLNADQVAREAFWQAYKRLFPSRYIAISEEIEMSTVKHFVDAWVSKASEVVPDYLQQISTLMEQSENYESSGIVENRHVTPDKCLTERDDWKVLYPIIWATRLPILIFRPDESEQKVDKILYSVKKTELLKLKLIAQLKKAPELMGREDHILPLNKLLYIFRSGENIYCPATEGSSWKRRLQQYKDMEFILVHALCDPIFIVDLHAASSFDLLSKETKRKKNKKKKAIKKRDSVCTVQDDKTSKSHANNNESERDASGAIHRKSDKADLVVPQDQTKNKGKFQDTEASCESSSIQRSTHKTSGKSGKKKESLAEFHQRLKIESDQARHRKKVIAALPEVNKKTLAMRSLNNVLENIKIGAENDEGIPSGRVHVSLSKLSDSCLESLHLANKLGDSTAPVILGMWKMKQFFIKQGATQDAAAVIRYLQTAVERGNQQGADLLFVFAAVSSSPEALSASLKSRQYTDYSLYKEGVNGIKLVFALDPELLALMNLSSSELSELAQVPALLARLVQKKNEGENVSILGWQLIDRVFDRDPVLESSWTPDLLFKVSESESLDNEMTETVESAKTYQPSMLQKADDTLEIPVERETSQALKKTISTMINVLLRGYFHHLTGDIEQALECFSHCSIKFSLMYSRKEDISHLGVAAGFAAIFMLRYLIEQCPSAVASEADPSIQQWKKILPLMDELMGPTNAQYVLYSDISKVQHGIPEPNYPLSLSLHYLATCKSRAATLEEVEGEIAARKAFLVPENNNYLLDQEVLKDGELIKEFDILTKNSTISELQRKVNADKVRDKLQFLDKKRVCVLKRPTDVMFRLQVMLKQMDELEQTTCELKEEIDKGDRPGMWVEQAISNFDGLFFVADGVLPEIQANVKPSDADLLRVCSEVKAGLLHKLMFTVHCLYALKVDGRFDGRVARIMLRIQRYAERNKKDEFLNKSQLKELDGFFQDFIALIDPRYYKNKSDDTVITLFSALNFNEARTFKNITPDNKDAVLNLAQRYIEIANNFEMLIDTFRFMVKTSLNDADFMLQAKRVLKKISFVIAKSVEYEDRKSSIDTVFALINSISDGSKQDVLNYWNEQVLVLKEIMGKDLKSREAVVDAAYDSLMKEENIRIESEKKRKEKVQEHYKKRYELHLTKLASKKDSEQRPSIQVESHTLSILVSHEEEKNNLYFELYGIYDKGSFDQLINKINKIEKKFDNDKLFQLRLQGLEIEAVYKRFLGGRDVIKKIKGLEKIFYRYSHSFSLAKNNYEKMSWEEKLTNSIFPNISKEEMYGAVLELQRLMENIKSSKDTKYSIKLLIDAKKKFMAQLTDMIHGDNIEPDKLAEIKCELELFYIQLSELRFLLTKLMQACVFLEGALYDQKYLAIAAAEIREFNSASKLPATSQVAEIPSVPSEQSALQTLKKVKKYVNKLITYTPDQAEMSRIIPKDLGIWRDG